MSWTVRLASTASASYSRNPVLVNRLRPLAMSLIRESTSSASFLTESAASLMRSTAPLVPGAPRKFWAAVKTPSTLSAESLILAHSLHHRACRVDDAGDLLRIDRLQERIRVDERRIQTIRGIVEVTGEH